MNNSLLDLLLNLLYYYFQKPPGPAKLKTAVLKIGAKGMATATLNWTNPTTRTDGSPLAATDIDHIDVFDAGVNIGTVHGALTTFTTGLLTVGTHSFTITVTDTTGHTSAPSNIASVTVPITLASPSAVTDLTAVLNP